jgi:3-hydroxymyristoyl/3-hydroxydecanoyl-(acyl carrier protein) dehydratase
MDSVETGRGGDDEGQSASSTVMQDIVSCMLETDVDGEVVRARCRYRSDMGILAGHFPGSPLVPGVYSVELSLKLLADSGINVALPVRVSRAKLSRPIKPGMVFTVALNCERTDDQGISASCVLRDVSPGQHELARLRIGAATPR